MISLVKVNLTIDLLNTTNVSVRFSNRNTDLLTPLVYRDSSITLYSPVFYVPDTSLQPLMIMEVGRLTTRPTVFYNLKKQLDIGRSVMEVAENNVGCSSVVKETIALAHSLAVPGTSLVTVGPNITTGHCDSAKLVLLHQARQAAAVPDRETGTDCSTSEEGLTEICPIEEQETFDNKAKIIINQLLYLTHIMIDDTDFKLLFENIQMTDEKIAGLINNKTEGYVKEADNIVYYHSVDKKGFKMKKIVVPDWFILLFSRSLHSSNSHFSGSVTTRVLNMAFDNPNIASLCKIAENSCASCVFAGMVKRREVSGDSNSNAPVPGYAVSIDFLENLPTTRLGNRFLMVVVCQASSYVVLLPQKTLTQQNTLLNMFNVLMIFPNLQEVRTDGSLSYGGSVTDYLSKLGVKHTYPGARSSQNGLAEIHIQIVSDLLRKIIYTGSDERRYTWDLFLSQVAKTINCTPRSSPSSNFSRAMLFFNQLNHGQVDSHLDTEIIDTLNEIQSHRIARMKTRNTMSRLPDLNIEGGTNCHH